MTLNLRATSENSAYSNILSNFVMMWFTHLIARRCGSRVDDAEGWFS